MGAIRRRTGTPLRRGDFLARSGFARPIFKFSLSGPADPRPRAKRMATCADPQRAGPRVWCGTCCRRKNPRTCDRYSQEAPAHSPPDRCSPGSADDTGEAPLPLGIRSGAGCLSLAFQVRVSPVEFLRSFDRPEGGDHIGDHVTGEDFDKADMIQSRDGPHPIWIAGLLPT
jgi:hypothetical protein